MIDRLLLIIPAFNEEENIVRVVQEIRDFFPQYDYIVVNDGSTDRTSEICHQEGFNILDLPINLGLAGAFQTGMKYASRKGYRCAMQFDADGQHRADYIEKMMFAMEEGADVVIGSRFVNKPKPFSFRMLGSRLIAGAIRIASGVKVKDPTSGMRLYSRKVCSILADNINYGPEPDTISFLIKKGMRVEEVQVEMEERIAGVSYLNIGRSCMYMIRMLMSILVIQGARK
jgi:glycosyltransferase involved in cell wall biosynthesis